MIRVDASQFFSCRRQSFFQRFRFLLDLFRRVRVRFRVVARVAYIQYLFGYPVLVARAVEDLCEKFNLCFNFGFVGV